MDAFESSRYSISQTAKKVQKMQENYPIQKPHS